MEANNFIKQFISQLGNDFAPGMESLSKDLQQQIKTAAQITFEKMDLVTRDDFEAQRAVLNRSREKLDQMEKKLAQLEQQIAGS